MDSAAKLRDIAAQAKRAATRAMIDDVREVFTSLLAKQTAMRAEQGRAATSGNSALVERYAREIAAVSSELNGLSEANEALRELAEDAKRATEAIHG